MTTSAVIYAAKSTEDKHGSIGTQLDDCRAMAAREGWTVAGEYSDEGFSAYSRNRGPQLAAARAHAARLGAVLVVQHSDRLSRGSGDAPGAAEHLAEILFWANRHGVQLRSVQDDFAFTNPLLAPVIASIMGMRNHEDSKRKGAATSAGKRRRVEQRGRPNGRPPYGYRIEGKLDESRLVVDQAEAAIVRRIFDSFAGGDAQLAIARALNAEGVPTQRSGRWAQGTIGAILRNPAYLGKVAYRGGLYDGRHAPIVDVEVFDRVQRVLGSAPARRGRRPVGTHLFVKGMLRCSCGSAMVPRTSRRKDGSLHATYQCIGRRDRGTDFCSRSEVRRELVDGAALRYFEQVGLDVDATREAFEAATGSKLAEIRALHGQAQHELLQKVDAIARVESDYLAGRLPAETFERLSARLRDELAAAEAQCERLAGQERDVVSLADAVDAEAAMLGYLTEIRSAIVGDVKGAEGLAAVRAALGTLFESFTLVDTPQESPVQLLQLAAREDRGAAVVAGLLGEPLDVVEAIDQVADVAAVTAGAGLALIPRVRREALADLAEGFTPVLRTVPLAERADNYLINSDSAYLFAPIVVVEERLGVGC